MGDVRADSLETDDLKVGWVSKDLSLGSGATFATLFTLDTGCAPGARWTISFAAGAPCTIQWRLSWGDHPDELPYAITGNTVIAQNQISRRLAALWVQTGLMRAMRVQVYQSSGQSIVVGARVTWDRLAAPIGVTALTGTTVV